MKRGAALLLCLVLLGALALSAGAEGQKLLYPGVAIRGDDVYCLGIPMTGGTIQATANGQEIDVLPTTLPETNLGVTYYCVVSVTSSLSNIQREQQRAGLLALSQALGPQDAMVLITMGRGVVFGEKLTDPAARAKAIEEACTYTVYGTDLYESIDTILSTIAQEETGLSNLVFFSDGVETANTVKLTEDQVARIVQGSGRAVNFIAMYTPPITIFARKQVDLLSRLAQLSLGGVCLAPYEQDPTNYVNAMENAAREMVNQTAAWTVLHFDAAALPRDAKTVELTVTWTSADRTVSDSVQISTAELPPLPTQPETEPPTMPPTTPPPTLPTAALPTAPQEPIPEYQGEGVDNMLYYIVIASALAVILIVLVLVIVATRKTVPSSPEPVERLEVPPRKPDPTPEPPELPQPTPTPEPELPTPEDSREPMLSMSWEAPAEPAPTPVEEPTPAEPAPTEPTPAEPVPAAEPPARPRLVPVPSCTVRLTPEGNPGGTVYVDMETNGRCTFGRNQKADVILNETDSSLSGLHFELQWDGRVLYLTDRNSTNGTAITGIPQRPGHWARIESGATIQAGAIRYKVKITKLQ